MPTTLDWLRSRDDAALTALLRARPDLLAPAPGDLAALARRLDTTASARRALDGLDKFGMQLLQGLVLLDAARSDVSVSRLRTFLGGPATKDEIAGMAATLQTLGLVRGSAVLHVPPAVVEALGANPAGLGATAGLDPAQMTAALTTVTDQGMTILQRLAAGPPVGAVGGSSALANTVSELVEAGLLVRLDNRTVELPREVALALRGPHPLGPALPLPPSAAPSAPNMASVDATAAGQALATLSRMTRALELFGDGTASALKSGGLGIRELRRIARQLDIDDHHCTLLLELLAVTGLIAAVTPRSGRATALWLPTAAADTFLAMREEPAWALLGSAWLDLRRAPSRLGERDPTNKAANALSVELTWRRGPAERRFVLGELAGLPAGSAAPRPNLLARLGFRAPRRDADGLATMTAAVLTEATAIGIVAFDALTSAGRALLAEDEAAAAAALKESMPAPVDTVLVQADLTVVAPGRLRPELAAALGRAADVESTGTATVYRVGAGSLRRALERGATTADLHQLFADHSATGVPQALTYLIDDVARRYGVLRAGGAGSYLRSDDPALVAEAIAAAPGVGLDLRRLAPTVAVSSADLPELIEALRAAGLSPAAEDATGAMLDLRPAPRRTASPRVVQHHWREPPPPSDEQIDLLIRRMRAADAVAGRSDGAGTHSSAEVLAILRHAVGGHTPVWIGYADTEGSVSRRIVEPIVVSGGTLLAYDRMRKTVRTFALHRVTDAVADAPAGSG